MPHVGQDAQHQERRVQIQATGPTHAHGQCQRCYDLIKLLHESPIIVDYPGAKAPGPRLKAVSQLATAATTVLIWNPQREKSALAFAAQRLIPAHQIAAL